MDLARIRREVALAQLNFAYVECHPTPAGSLQVLTALQTTQNRLYTLAINFPDNYPNSLPTVTVRKPELLAHAPHRYTSGNICYLHPSMWNPGRHSLMEVMQRAAKWLAKYDVWLATGKWPGASIAH
jgi:ubiquitin-protein ligase